MDDSWIQREPSVGDISRTSHSDERYVANHYAPPMRQANLLHTPVNLLKVYLSSIKE